MAGKNKYLWPVHFLKSLFLALVLHDNLFRSSLLILHWHISISSLFKGRLKRIDENSRISTHIFVFYCARNSLGKDNRSDHQQTTAETTFSCTMKHSGSGFADLKAIVTTIKMAKWYVDKANGCWKVLK